MATFSSLPAELRIAIWQFSIPEPRNLVLSWNGKEFRSNSTPPNTAHVCHEAREETAETYDLTFASPKSTPKIWFDFARDALYITDDAQERMPAEILERVQRLKHFRYTGAMAIKCSS
ncbi:putative 2EXR domain-containing protein [Septoria linicola]|nr:putative 2EXR domain-containing protein [Septoria linicola]